MSLDNFDIDHPAVQAGVEALFGQHPERGGPERQQAAFAVIQAALPYFRKITPKSGPGNTVTPIYLVKLVSDEYSVPRNSIGYIYPDRDEHGDDIYTVHWAESPGPGGASMPVILGALEVLGRIWIPLEIMQARTDSRKMEAMLQIMQVDLESLLRRSKELLPKDEE